MPRCQVLLQTLQNVVLEVELGIQCFDLLFIKLEFDLLLYDLIISGVKLAFIHRILKSNPYKNESTTLKLTN